MHILTVNESLQLLGFIFAHVFFHYYMLHTCSLVISNNYPKYFKLLHHLVWRVELVIFYFSVIGIDLNSVVFNFLSSILGGNCLARYTERQTL